MKELIDLFERELPNFYYKIIVTFKYNLQEIIFCNLVKKMNNLRKVAEKRKINQIYSEESRY